MARQTAKAREQARSPPKQRVSKSSPSQVPAQRAPIAHSATITGRQLRETRNAKSTQKPKETVSVAGLFRKDKSIYRDKKVHRKQRIPTSEPEPDLYLEFRGL
jgi:hypothetical protein